MNVYPFFDPLQSTFEDLRVRLCLKFSCRQSLWEKFTPDSISDFDVDGSDGQGVNYNVW